MAEDIRSMRCVFVSHCIMVQCVRAEGLARCFSGPVKPVVQFMLDHDINIMQMPCPETLSSAGGLGRQPHGKKWYEEHGLRETAAKIALDQATYMRTLVDQGCEILSIIGMEFSPACATSLLNRGPVVYRGKGIYIEELERALADVGLSVPVIGVNQRALKRLQNLLALLVADAPQEDIAQPRLVESELAQAALF